jgi:anti-sigma regulatory factor (Ser/Thr protein kinase)
VSDDRGWRHAPRFQPPIQSRADTNHHVRVSIDEEADVAMARKAVRRLAPLGGLSDRETHALTTAVSEIVWNIVTHARAGELTVDVIEGDVRRGVRVIAHDAGPGIPDADRAMQDGYSTGRGLGLGLPSARRLVDDFALVSHLERGTTVTLTKWAT